MSLRRQLLVSFGVQGAGAASVLLATLWLGRSLGPEVQGGFSRAKSEVEFVAALAMFGLPQALFFHLQSGSLSARAALRWVGASAVLAIPIGLLYAVVQHPGTAALVLWLAAAVAACVAHGQLRAMLLVRSRATWFNVATALPQLGMLVGVGVAIGTLTAVAFAPSIWFAVFWLAYGVAALSAWWVFAATPGTAANSTVGWRALGHYGLAAWLSGALSTAAVLAMQHGVESAAGAAALGQFTMAMALLQVPLTPISYAAPLLFRRWMEQPGARASRRWSGWLFATMLVLAALVWWLSARWPDLGLGAAYAGVGQALAVLLIGGAAEAASRLLTAQASASGLPWVAVRAEAARWAVLLLAAISPLPHGLLPLCAAWSAAAMAAALVFAWHGRMAALPRGASR